MDQYPGPGVATIARPLPWGAGGSGWPAPAPPDPPAFGHPSVTPQPDPGHTAPPGGQRRKRWILASAAGLLLVAAVATTGYLGTRPSAASGQQSSGQTELPFSGIDFRLSPGGVALDKAGDVYVTSEGMYGRVVELPAGSSTPTVLPLSGLYQPQGLAVDSAGAVYVADFDNRVVKLTAGSSSQTVLPFTGLNYPEGVAVDKNGNVYVADRGNDRTVRLAA